MNNTNTPSNSISNFLDKVLDQGAFLRLGGEWWLVRGPFEVSENFENDRISITWQDFFSSTIAKSRRYYRGVEERKLTTGELREGLCQWLSSQDEAGKQGAISWQWTSLSRDSFEQSFRSIQGEISSQKIHKAVLTLNSWSAIHPRARDLAEMVLRLIDVPENLKAFGFWMGVGSDQRGVIGATPEVLFQKQGQEVETMSLAGTRSKSKPDLSLPDLLADPKERQEHQWVVEDISNSLREFGRLKKGEISILDLPHLQHLQTPIRLTLKDDLRIAPEDLISSLHPTAALGSFPKSYAKSSMERLPEQQDRGAFGAPLTFCFPNDFWISLVAIRSLFWGPKGSQIGVGCGIVNVSDQEREWNELHAKLDTIFQTLGLEL